MGHAFLVFLSIFVILLLYCLDVCESDRQLLICDHERDQGFWLDLRDGEIQRDTIAACFEESMGGSAKFICFGSTSRLAVPRHPTNGSTLSLP